MTVVASQLRGYGVWDGGVAMGGALLAGWKGPAPSLLFLWVSAAQANLLQRELSLIQKSSARANGESSSDLLPVEQRSSSMDLVEANAKCYSNMLMVSVL